MRSARIQRLVRWVGLWVLILGGLFSIQPSQGSAGGGNNYSAGGSSSSFGGFSSGGSHSSSGGGGTISPLGAAILVVFLIILVASSRKNKARATISVDANARDQSIAKLKNHDAAFDPVLFADRVKKVVVQVNQAWLEGDMNPARRLISDGVFIRFQTQLRLMTQQGVRNFMTNWRVISAEILTVDNDAHWDTVHVKVVAEARDTDVSTKLSADQVARMLQQTPLRTYQEVWSFIRRRGVQTKTGIPILEGLCPNCGAALPKSESVQCEHCQAIVTSGEHDFVLAEITQPEEWRPGATLKPIAGLAELQRHDPMVSRQEVEDRASVVFWKWIAARTTGNANAFARFCDPHIPRDAWPQQLALQPGVLYQVAVGSVDMLSAFAPTPESPFQRVCVDIKWSALVPNQGTRTFRYLLTLRRPADAKSPRGFSSLHCTQCGGPLPESDALTCPYCEASLAPKSHEWLLTQVVQAAV